ncbi:beta strand repeat-containing protein, partial [Sulfitobacter geojensis]|uniref:beta strand repeat-containing protein n=1 Tax=Sulfitobacter geojensis TaxID=1342299 RepID=UPI00193B8401
MLHFGKARAAGNTSRGLFLTTALISGMIAFPGHAADVTWSNPAAGNYNDTLNWLSGALPLGTDTAIFDGTPASTVTIGAVPVTVTNLTVAEIGSIADGTIAFASGTASTLTYSDVHDNALAGNLTLDLNGADLNIVATTNLNFAGDIVNGGASAATLDINTTATMNLSGDITGDTSVTLSAGDLTLAGTNTYTGATTVTTGTLQVTGGAAIADAGAVVVNGGTFALLANETIGTLEGAGGVNVNANTLTVAGAGDKTFSGALSGAGVVSKTNSGTLTLTGDNSALLGGMQIGAGVIDGNSDDAFGTGLITLNGGTMAVSGTTTVSNAIAVGAGNGTITGADATLTGDISATGALTFGNGTDAAQVVVNSTTASAAAATTVSELATVVLGTSQSVNLFANGGVVDGTLDLNGNDTATGNLSGAGTVTNNAATGTAVLTVGGDGTASGSFTGTITDGTTATTGLALNKGLTTDEFSLTTSQTYTGGTTINTGVLSLNVANALADAGAVTVNTNGTLALVTGAETIGALDGAGKVTLGANTLTVGGAADTEFSGVISGTGGLTLDKAAEADVFKLSGDNTYTGTTTVTTGTLVVSGNEAIDDDGSVVVSGGSTLRVDASEDVGLLDGAGSV